MLRPVNVLLMMVLGLLLGWGLPVPPPAWAQGGQFTSEAAVTFGQKIEFSLTAVTDLHLETVTLFFQTADAAAPRSVGVALTQIKDGMVVARYIQEPQPVRLAPLTTITYWWQIETADGRLIPVPAQTVTYQDDRFNWQELIADEGGTAVTIYWTGEALVTGEVAYQIIKETLPRLKALAPLPAGVSLTVFLYPSAAELRAALRLNGHDWAQAHVDPALGVVMVTAVNSKTAYEDLRRPLPHELAHFWLYQVAGPHYETIPPWFKEGVAVWLAGDYEAEATLLATAVAQNATIPLDDLCHTFSAQHTPLASAQSASLVQFVLVRYGSRTLSDLTAAFMAGADCETAVSDTLQQSLAEFENEWLAATRPQPAMVNFMRQNGLWLLLLLGGFVIMGLLILRPKPV